MITIKSLLSQRLRLEPIVETDYPYIVELISSQSVIDKDKIEGLLKSNIKFGWIAYVDNLR